MSEEKRYLTGIITVGEYDSRMTRHFYIDTFKYQKELPSIKRLLNYIPWNNRWNCLSNVLMTEKELMTFKKQLFENLCIELVEYKHITDIPESEIRTRESCNKTKRSLDCCSYRNNVYVDQFYDIWNWEFFENYNYFENLIKHITLPRVFPSEFITLYKVITNYKGKNLDVKKRTDIISHMERLHVLCPDIKSSLPNDEINIRLIAHIYKFIDMINIDLLTDVEKFRTITKAESCYIFDEGKFEFYRDILDFNLKCVYHIYMRICRLRWEESEKRVCAKYGVYFSNIKYALRYLDSILVGEIPQELIHYGFVSKPVEKATFES